VVSYLLRVAVPVRTHLLIIVAHTDTVERIPESLMFTALLATNPVMQYLNFYQRYLLQKWDNLTPMQYGSMLITIGVVGWLMMKSGPK